MSLNLQGNDAVSTNLGFTMDLGSAPAMDDRSDLPDGEYVVQLTDAAPKITAEGAGRGFTAELTVVQGPFAGRKQFEFVNCIHPNVTAQEIGRKLLKSFCDGLGIVGQFSGDVRQLTQSQRPFLIGIKNKPDKRNNNEIRANIVKVAPLQQGGPANGQQPGQIPQQSAPAQQFQPGQQSQQPTPQQFQPQQSVQGAPSWSQQPQGTA